MRTIWAALLCAGVAACAAESDDDTVTDDGNEIVEGASTVERKLSPPIAAPEGTPIGKKTSEVLAETTAGLTGSTAPAGADGCAVTSYRDTAGKTVATRQKCRRSEVIRKIGDPDTVHSDLDGDGLVDQFTGRDGAVVLYADANFDGKVDKIVERVDALEDFSLDGYPKGYRETKFLYRIREDRDRDGKLEIEALVARGQLKPR